MSASDAPRLRSVEAFAVEHEGQRCVALRDPAGYTDSVVVLPPALVELVALFDGQHSVVDIQAELTRRFGEIVPRADIERVVDMLDEQGFMDTARFAAVQAATDGRFLADPTRPAVHAGGAYAGEPDELKRMLEGCFGHPDGPGPIGPWAAVPGVRAVIAPHIDFHRGGPAYGWAYRDVAERCDADLFVIFGTCHAGMADPFALTTKDYDTPLGPVRTDRDVMEALARRAGHDWLGSQIAHRAEHSIEFQAVWLQYLFGGGRPFTVVPVLTSFAHEALAHSRRPEDDARVARFLDAVGETLAATGRRAAVIAGADLAHVGPRFGDPEPVSEAERERIAHEDRQMLRAVEAGDAAAFFAAVAQDGDRRRICGLSPIYALLRVVDGARGALRHYGQWPDPQGLVSYASVVYDGR